MTRNDVQKLLSLPDPQFREVVDAEVRGTAQPKVGETLRDPLLIDRWHHTLLQMKKSVESQLGAKRSDVFKNKHYSAHDLAEFHRWRAGAVRFKSGVEDRLLEIRRIRGIAQPDTQAIKRERNALLQAIDAHRQTVLEEFEADEISDADRALWAALGD